MNVFLPEIHTALSQGAAHLAALAVGQLWQGAAVAAALALCLRLAPRTRASHRFLLWLAAFALVTLAPLLQLLPRVSSPAVGGKSAASAVAWLEMDDRWALALLGLWALAALWRLALLWLGALRARTIWKNAKPMPDLQQLVCEKLPARAAIEICLTHELERPSVIGFFRPRILVPDWLAEKLTPAEMQQIVLHEFEHLRRWDDWSNLGLRLASALLPLNPALWWMERELEREREMATDEAVVRRTRAPRAYAACLASVAERRLQMRRCERALLALAIWRRRPELAERILSLLKSREMLGPIGRTALAGSLFAGLALAAVAVVHAPQLVAFSPAVQPVQVAARSVLPVVIPQIESVGSHLKAARRTGHLPVVAPAAALRQPVAGPESSGPHDGVLPVVARVEQAEAGSIPRPAEGWVVLTVVEERGNVGQREQLVADYPLATESSTAKSRVPARHAKPAVRQVLTWHVVPVAQVEQEWLVLAM